jgi:hypothetical protein
MDLACAPAGRSGKYVADTGGNMPDQQAEMPRSNPLAAAVLIALLGPPLGALAVLLWNNVLQIGWLVLPFAGSGSMPLDWYMLGGAQSLACALIVSARIHRYGWVSLAGWLLLAALVSLAAAVAFHLTVTAHSKSDLFPKPFADDLAFFVIATLFAAVALRAIVIGLGWMRRHDAGQAESI